MRAKSSRPISAPGDSKEFPLDSWYSTANGSLAVGRISIRRIRTAAVGRMPTGNSYRCIRRFPARISTRWSTRRRTSELEPPDGRRGLRFSALQLVEDIVPIRSIDRGKREITLARDASYAVRPGDRYYVQNLLEELDSPGEWYLDRRSSTLYFWPPKPLAASPSTCRPCARS